MMGKRHSAALSDDVSAPRPTSTPAAKVTAMLHPSDPTFTRPLAVREGHGAPVTCAACGCRLTRHDDDAWFHFSPMGGRDARGCRVACADAAHDQAGQPVALPA